MFQRVNVAFETLALPELLYIIDSLEYSIKVKVK